MKRLLLIAGIVFLLLSCNTGGMEKEDPSTYTLIGTWEASGEYVVILAGNDEQTYKSILTFLNETDYIQETHYKSKQGIFDLIVENKGTYIYDEEKITYTDSYRTSPDQSFGGSNVYSKLYNFINRNTLETYGPGIDNLYIKSMTYRRK